MEKTQITTRGRKFVGTVVADRMPKTVTVEWDRRKYLPKFERYAKRRTRVKAHNPKEIDAKVGDIVRIAETRKLSKTKSFIILEILSQDEDVIALKERHDEDAEAKENKVEEKKSAKKSEKKSDSTKKEKKEETDESS